MSNGQRSIAERLATVVSHAEGRAVQNGRYSFDVDDMVYKDLVVYTCVQLMSSILFLKFNYIEKLNKIYDK